MRIGLTGSIATGKSTVANMLREEGYPVIDADVIAREIVTKGSTALEEIKATFGSSMLHLDGTLNREALGGVIFNDEEKRKLLNSITHPKIRAEMLRQAAQYEQSGESIVFLDIPLLFESKLEGIVDAIWVVAVSEDTQLKRLMLRNELTEELALLRIRSQTSIVEKVTKADIVIHNEGLKEETRRHVQECIRELKQKSM